MKKKKRGKGLLWIILICIAALLSGFYFRRQITSKLGFYASKARSVIPAAGDRHPPQAISPKPPIASSTKSTFTFSPDEKDRFAWSVKYPDGRVFKFGEEFSSDCAPRLKLAKVPTFEFVEQRSCNAHARKPIQVDANSLRDAHGGGSPEVIASVVTGGNVNGHTVTLIALTSKGPKVVRRMD
jgi:hypothetical protein